jgi:hypothetical protein
MRRERVSSSSLVSIGYEEEAVLEVEIAGGAVYRYFVVPRSVYDGLMSAASKGRYFNTVIRAGGYPFERVR